jgi:molybdopterin biosynthesis enzyme
VLSAFTGRPAEGRHTLKAKLAEEIGGVGPGFELYIRMHLEKTEEGYLAHPLSHFKGSMIDVIRAEGLYITKLKPEPTGKGDLIEVELLR